MESGERGGRKCCCAAGRGLLFAAPVISSLDNREGEGGGEGRGEEGLQTQSRGTSCKHI